MIERDDLAAERTVPPYCRCFLCERQVLCGDECYYLFARVLCADCAFDYLRGRKFIAGDVQ